MSDNLLDSMQPGVDFVGKVKSQDLAGKGPFEITDVELIEKSEERIDPVDGVLRDMVTGDYYKVTIALDGGEFVWCTGASPLRPILKGLLDCKDRLPLTTEIRAVGQTYEFCR